MNVLYGREETRSRGKCERSERREAPRLAPATGCYPVIAHADLTELFKVIALMTQEDHLLFIERGDHIKPCWNGRARRNHGKIERCSTAFAGAVLERTGLREAELRPNVGTIITLDEGLQERIGG